MNLQKIIDLMGVGDGLGNTSSSRVVLYLVVFSVLGPKIFVAFKTLTPVVWSETDIMLISAAFAGKLVNTNLENKAGPPS